MPSVHLKPARFQTRRYFLATLIVLVLFAYCPCVASGPAKLKVSFWGSSYEGCDTSSRRLPRTSYLVGGAYDITIAALPKGEGFGDYEGITDWSWPKGLIIKVGQTSSVTDSFDASDSLRNLLGLEYYITVDQIKQDSIWRAYGGGRNVLGVFDAFYHFAFRVPTQLAGSYLCVKAEWDHPHYGHLETPEMARIKIQLPCSEHAFHHVWSSQVKAAEQQGAFDAAISLADYFLTLGWHDVWGLIAAESAAKKAGRNEDFLRFKELILKEPAPVMEY